MDLVKRPKLKSAPSRKNHSVLVTVGKSLAASSAVAAVIAFLAIGSSGTLPWAPNKAGDSVTQQELEARQAAFVAQLPIELSMVRDTEIPTVVASMELRPEEKRALLQSLGMPSKPKAEVVAAQAQLAQAHVALPPPVAQPQDARQIGLAWITLWDTDAEDGDVVRIDSVGYSRTITLTKRPVMIAVPVPHDSVLSITGIRDGEGGGITVGFASGGTSAVFPVMSIGQTLGLKAQFN